MSKTLIRHATKDDAVTLLKIHYDSVHTLGASDYAPDILKYWSTPIDQCRIKRFLETFESETHLVAEYNNEIVGFSAIALNKKEIQACYISPHATRKGIGKKLIKELENIAQKHNINALELNSSLTAKQFYLQCNYKIIEQKKYTLHSGIKMDCIRMQKTLNKA